MEICDSNVAMFSLPPPSIPLSPSLCLSLSLSSLYPPLSLHSWGSLLASATVPSGSVPSGGSGVSGASSLSVGNFARRGRIWLRRRGMGRSLVARWPIVPASEVPDDLVDQAMAVLQGKSREAVIRELQRTVSVSILTAVIPLYVCMGDYV